MLDELEAYYRDAGILATAFRCTSKHECSNDCPDFTGPKSAFVSTGYEQRSLPRLLFLSLDSGSGAKNDPNRLPRAVRKQEEEERYVPGLPKHKHWYRTHELAWYVLREFKPNLRIEEAKSYFAHANSAKCCMNKPQRKKANAVLFRNCQRYILKEFKILDPEIIVTQGNEAKLAIQMLSSKIIGTLDEFASVIQLNGCEVFWLHTYHPSNWGAFNKQRDFNKQTQAAEGWSRYAGLISTYIKRNA